MTVPNPDDDQALLEVVTELARKLGRVPGRDAVREATGVGSPRATRLLNEWKARQGVTSPQHSGGSAEDRAGAGHRLSVVPTGTAAAPRASQQAPALAGPTEAGQAESTIEMPAITQADQPEPETRPVKMPDRAPDRSGSEVARPVDPTSRRPTARPQSDVDEPDRSSTDTASGRTEHPAGEPTTTGSQPTAHRWSAGRVGLLWAVPVGVVTLLGFGLASTSAGRGVLDWFGKIGADRLILTAGVVVAVALLATIATTARRQMKKPTGPWSPRVLLVGALVGVTVSGDTAWRFFDHYGQATSVGERIGIFAGVEVVLVGCGLAMHERAKEGDPLGQFRTAVWVLCGFSAFAALTLQGWPGGVYRVVGGPVVAVVALHLALGIEIRQARGGRRGGTWGKVTAEVRERLLSRLGLGDDGRDALARTRHRAAIRAARLAYGGGMPFRRNARMRKALVTAHIAQDEQTRQVFESTLDVLRESEQWMSVRPDLRNSGK